MNEKTLKITQGAIIAAMYIVLTFVSQAVGLASGAIQFRLSEGLTILPLFTSAAIPGLAIGCLLANLLTGCAVWDIVIGSLATLIGALGTYWIREKNPYLGPVFPILTNMIFIPPVLRYVYGIEGSMWYFALTVGIGELVCCGILGLALYKALKGKTQWFSSLS